MKKHKRELSDKEIDIIITERDFYKKILQSIPAVIHVNNLSTELVEWVNDAGERISGYTREEIVNNPNFLPNVIVEEDLEWIAESIIDYKKDNGVSSYVYSMRNADGTLSNYHGIGVVFERDENGIPLKNLAIDIDVTHEIRNYIQLKRQFENLTKKLNSDKLDKLTKIEVEVIKNICKGKTVDEISKDLKRSYHTIDNHKRNIFKKLLINKTSQLIYFAKEVGLI
ncbi:MAG TPA: PAS domain-containing protein [Tenuifilaceae bacterium]|nr:PAS domain-containing protein [Tenuifilaceae bacterium]HPE19057.1 PAS domain-containing protein [Tenuifilaceae bacterium]HPJ46471.1 PAS domain-containing protein [Tenuifilaceae bacterium]HPQ34628.1 PAS domain-containing protein [Tenuifilaceae bacterium]HRX68595.1 PAS domain-containing protein [Tenuifilaceae bacterium]